MKLQRTTQHRALLQHFMKGKSLTPIQAIKVAGTLKLSTRCAELVKAGYKIDSCWTQSSNGKRFKRYWMTVWKF